MYFPFPYTAPKPNMSTCTHCPVILNKSMRFNVVSWNALMLQDGAKALPDGPKTPQDSPKTAEPKPKNELVS